MRRRVDLRAPGRPKWEDSQSCDPYSRPLVSAFPEWLKKRSGGTSGAGCRARPPGWSMRTRPPSLDALGAGGGSPEADVRYAGVSAP